MNNTRPRYAGAVPRAAAIAFVLSLGCLSPPAFAQADRLSIDSPVNSIVPEATEKNALERGRYAILIDLDENRLYFKQGDVTLWSAPVGTGTAMRVITHEDDWEFSTPTGRFQVQYKERDPIWIAPDWYFVENNLPVPSKDHPSRYMKNTLGVAAVYISPHLAIHGTDRPELIGQRVSHGCIRLENRYALRLYNNVQVGTEVIIVGGDDVEGRVVDLREGYDPSLSTRGRPRPATSVDRIHEGWKAMRTPALLEALDEQLDLRRDSRWDEVALLLVDRAADGDEDAMMGLLSRSSGLPTAVIEKEWGTLLAEVYRRATVTTLEALSDLTLRERRKAAELLVTASVTLFGGDLDSQAVPWPSTRIPATLASRRARAGQEAIAAAERAHREQISGELASR